MFTVSRFLKLLDLLATNLVLSHEPFNPLLVDMEAAFFERSGHSNYTVRPANLFHHVKNFGDQDQVRVIPISVLHPSIVAGTRSLQTSTHRRYIEDAAVLVNPGVPNYWFRAKNAAAFFRMSASS